MKQAQIAKIWLFINLPLLYYALNAWILSQGGEPVFGAHLLLSTGVAAVATAVPICAILLTLTGLVGSLFAGRERKRWHRRIPIIGFERFKTGSYEGKIYQAIVFALFQVFPWLAMVHFWLVFLNADAIALDKHNHPIQKIGIWDWAWLGNMENPARICEHIPHAAALICQDGATLLPGLEPAIFAVLTLLAMAASLRYYLAVFIRKNICA